MGHRNGFEALMELVSTMSAFEKSVVKIGCFKSRALLKLCSMGNLHFEEWREDLRDSSISN